MSNPAYGLRTIDILNGRELKTCITFTEGLQAQSLAVERSASSQSLHLIPILNKIDLPHSNPEVISSQIEDILSIPKEEHMYISAKSGKGVEEVLRAIVERVPAPGEWRERVGRLAGGGRGRATDEGQEEKREGGEKAELGLAREGESDEALRGLVIDT